MFRRFLESQLDRVRKCPQAGMLEETVFEKLESFLGKTIGIIANSTETHLISFEAADNPFAASIPDFLTKEEKNKARVALRQKIEDGTMHLPGPLVDCLSRQLTDVTDSFLEMLSRMEENRDAVCAALTGGRLYHKIEDIELSAGDTHNHGRSVMILHTDAGKLVYKPHDLRLDRQIFLFAERFFPEFVGIARSVSFGEGFGVCEYIEKRRAEGEEEAEQFWYALGGLTAFAKLLGSTDLHYQNLICSGTKTYMVDLETVFSALTPDQAAYFRFSETRKHMLHSPSVSQIMPSRFRDVEFSALTNTAEDGIAPLVNGKPVTVMPYLPAFQKGYHTAFARAIECREEIEEAVRSFPPDNQIRNVLRPTRFYWEILKKLYHHTALESEESRKSTEEVLFKLLQDFGKNMGEQVIRSEAEQLLRGDIPYFYSCADGLDLYADGEKLVEGQFCISAVGNILDILSGMDEEDERFDLACIDRAIRQYPLVQGRTQNSGGFLLQKTKTPLPVSAAAEEAKRIFDEMYDQHIPAPGGKLLWGSVGSDSYGFVFSDHGLFNGLTGLSVFACACASVWNDGRILETADKLAEGAAEEIRDLLWRLEEYEGGKDGSIPLGEAEGVGGILKGMALINRYRPGKMPDELCRDLFRILEKTEFAMCRETDRITGLAGLLSALCRFEEYKDRKKIIRAVADRLLERKTFAYRDALLWKTMAGIPRMISGAGHGMAGIAEALFAAADVLRDDRYLPAACEALEYEEKAYFRYAEKFGTWADLREFPPKSYMHGYCAGAPGIGIMLSRIRSISKDTLSEPLQKAADSETTARLEDLTKKALERIPLNRYDHLCCGNAAVAEYYLSAGDREEAGKVLASVREHRKQAGRYADMSWHGSSIMTASLFNGFCGIGYEMLRYAFPDRILSVL